MSERPVMPSELLGSGDTITFAQYVIGRLVLTEGYRFCMASEATIRLEAAANGEPMPEEPLPDTPFVFFSEWLVQLMTELKFTAVLVKPKSDYLSVIALTQPQGTALTATSLSPADLLRIGENTLTETHNSPTPYRRLTFHVWEWYDEPLTNDLRKRAAQWRTHTPHGTVRAFGWILCPPRDQYYLDATRHDKWRLRGLIRVVKSLLSGYVEDSTWEDVFKREWMRLLPNPNVWRMGWWIWQQSIRDSSPPKVEEQPVEPEN